MKGLGISFLSNGAVLNLNKAVEDFETIAQNGLVNIGTIKDAESLHPNRGTDLYQKGVIGALTTYQVAYHASNFAALDTAFFLRETDYVDSDYERIDYVALEPKTFENGRLKLNARFEGEFETIIGKNIYS